MKSNRRIIIPVALSAAVVLIFLILFFLLKSPALPAGKLTVKSGSGDTIATYSENRKKLTCTDAVFADYTDMAINEAADIISDIYSHEFETAELYGSDIQIHTCFSLSEYDCIKSALEKLDFGDRKTAEAVICTPDGRIIASVGGGDNIISSPHTPGSALKPLSVYAPAIKNGTINWASRLKDSPFKKVNVNGALKDWPSNYSGKYSNSDVSVYTALGTSLNTVSVNVLDLLTPALSCEFLTALGIDVTYESEYTKTAQVQEIYGNLALGALKGGITTQNLTAAYQIFVNGGVFTKPYCVEKIICGGKVIYTANPKSVRILDPSDAEIMNLLLQGTTAPDGTGAAAYIEGMKIGGKTSTSEDYRDNWFIGFTPEYICGVWYGYDQPLEKRDRNEAVTVFKEIVSGIENDTDAQYPHSDDTVQKEYCVYTSCLASEGCNKTETGYFNKNRLPDICDRH